MSIPKKKATFAQRYQELEKLVAWFERENFELEEGIDKYQSGLALVKELKKELSVLENTIKDIKANS